jgi:hypothetical protein
MFIASVLPVGASAQIRGDAEARAAAERLLEHAGGRDAWAGARTFYVEERVFLASGEIGQLRIWRDLETGNRRLERASPAGHYAEWLSSEGGFEVRDGVVSNYAPEDLAIELQGLRQEPYAIYRRLAVRDPELRVQLRDKTSLLVYDGQERLLCWFLLDGKGRNISWGNFWNGSINQHYYGPTVDFGDANLPKWGVSSTGSFRFEYVLARLNGEPVEAPALPAASPQ